MKSGRKAMRHELVVLPQHPMLKEPGRGSRGHIYQARQLPHHTRGPGLSSQHRRKGREKEEEEIWKEEEAKVRGRGEGEVGGGVGWEPEGYQ